MRWLTEARIQFLFFFFFFFILQETVSLFTKSFVSHKADEEKPSFSKSEPRAVVPVTQMTKWIRRGAIMTDINNDTAWWASSGKHKAHSMQWVFFWPTEAIFKKAVCIDVSLTKRHQILTNGVASLAWVKLRSDQNLLSTLWKWASWQNLFCSGRDLIPPYSPCAEFDKQKAFRWPANSRGGWDCPFIQKRLVDYIL